MTRIITADALDGLKTLPDGCVDMCVTSPPYFCLRDYQIAGQIGLEETPEEYISRLVAVFREVRRVLRDDGTLWVVIGDSYTSGNRKYRSPDKKTPARTMNNRPATPLGLKPKDLIGVPWLLAFALRADGWRLRQDIIVSKNNPMPESVKDRCTKSHEYLFLLSKSKRYYFDAEAIAEPVAEATIKRLNQNVASQAGSDRIPGKTNGPMKAVPPRFGGSKYGDVPDAHHRTKSGNPYHYKPKRNKRDVWSISTRPYKGAHFAVFPPDLVRPCILAGSRKGGVVLDPFLGSGTTAAVALEEGRECIGIELNPAYVELARERVRCVTMKLC